MRILFLDLDTLRPDHLGCYGYHRNTSPNIDAIARQGVRFDNYYCSDAPCLPSRAALVTGRFGIHTGVVGHGGTAADLRLEGSPRGFRDRVATESLWAFIRSAGLKTASISPFAERHGAWWFNAGLNEAYNTGRRGHESAEEITPVALKWIEDNAKADNWLLHVNYWDPHAEYRAPAEFGNPFKDDPLPDFPTAEDLARHREMVGPHKPWELNMFNNGVNPKYPRQPGELKDMADVRRMFDGYDCGIAYMDNHIGQLFDALDSQGVMDDLVIIITADHAECMGELGIYVEHGTADRGTCRIPMIIRWPGVTKPGVDSCLHYNLDLGPTLAELLKKEQPASWDGRSFAATLAEGKDCGREYLILSQCAHVCQRGVRFGPWLYIRTYHDGYHLFPDEMLFDIEQDPYEQNDVAAANPKVCRQATFYLSEWHDAMMKTMPYEVDPLWTVIREGGPAHARGRLREYCEYLEKTGRGWAIPELKRRHPREFE